MRAATKLKAEATLAKEAAIHEKQSLDRFRTQRNKEHTAYVHKTAAYLEIKRAAKEARKAKQERKVADDATKVYRAKKREAQQARIRATLLEEKSKKDKAAALREVKLAAKTGLTVHAAVHEHGPGVGEGHVPASKSLAIETAETTLSAPWAKADEEFESMAKVPPASSKDIAQEVVSAIFNGPSSDVVE